VNRLGHFVPVGDAAHDQPRARIALPAQRPFRGRSGSLLVHENSVRTRAESEALDLLLAAEPQARARRRTRREILNRRLFANARIEPKFDTQPEDLRDLASSTSRGSSPAWLVAESATGLSLVVENRDACPSDEGSSRESRSGPRLPPRPASLLPAALGDVRVAEARSASATKRFNWQTATAPSAALRRSPFRTVSGRCGPARPESQSPPSPSRSRPAGSPSRFA